MMPTKSVFVDNPLAVSPMSPVSAATDVYQQLGTMARTLHDTMSQLGIAPKLSELAGNLPDARSRLTFIATKTADAAGKVLDLVDEAKSEHRTITIAARSMVNELVRDPVKAVAEGSLLKFVSDVETSTARIDERLTDIMLAQDFHDLTGQVVAKVIQLASDMEAQLVQLLINTAPTTSETISLLNENTLNGPVINPDDRTDVVTSQVQVDDLLSSLGF